MSWFKKSISSSLGRKLIMGLTGLFLISFLVVHCGINACIFLNDGGKTFEAAAHFMGSNFFIRTAEIGLFVGLILHIVDGLLLWNDNRKKRPVAYAMVSGETSTWYSRSMGLLGTILLIFLVLHLKHFWYVSRLTDHLESGETLYAEMIEVFENPIIVLIYVLGCVSLGYHLLHGFQSAFQTMGWNHPKYMPLIKSIGAGFSIVVPFIFALMPIAMYLGWIK